MKSQSQRRKDLKEKVKLRTSFYGAVFHYKAHKSVFAAPIIVLYKRRSVTYYAASWASKRHLCVFLFSPISHEQHATKAHWLGVNL